MPEAGDPALRKAIAEHYRDGGVEMDEHEIFVSSGACDVTAPISFAKSTQACSPLRLNAAPVGLLGEQI